MLILTKMLRFPAPASVGVLAAACAPPAMLALPLAAILQADVALVAVMSMGADIISIGEFTGFNPLETYSGSKWECAASHNSMRWLLNPFGRGKCLRSLSPVNLIEIAKYK